MTSASTSVKNKNILQRGNLILDGHDLIVQLLVADGAVLAFAVVQDVFVIRFCHGGVQRNVDSTDRHDGVIHDVPFAAIVVGNQGDFRSFFYPHGNQPACRLVHCMDELLC